MYSLAELQKKFSLALLDAQQADNMVELFEGSEPQVLNALGIYRGNRISNLLASMRASYPVIEQLVGADFFEGLVRAYIRQNPSRSGNLHDYGASFEDFLAHFEPANHLAYLSDVAKLEWLVHLAYGCSDYGGAEYIPPTEPWLTTSENFYVLESAFPIVSIWQAHQGGSAELKSLENLSTQQSEIALVYRPKNASPRVDRLNAVQAQILELAKEGITLEQVIEAVSSGETDLTCTVENISQQMIGLIQAGYLVLKHYTPHT